ncbi:MAG: T9SS type A sorting domain-containing protein [Flavobacteriales bacterium]|nr:T9SS type A sorting domain-containing protein [Flavobacteriales bacterium]
MRPTLAFAFLLVSATALAQLCGNPPPGFLPIPDMGSATFQGMSGGLYGGGSNSIPSAHLEGSIQMAQEIQPLDADGNPDPQGWVVFMGVGMSNASLCWNGLRDSTQLFNGRNPSMKLVSAAVGGKDIDRMLDTTDSYWAIVQQRLDQSQVTAAQVQAVWFLQAQHIATIPQGMGIAHLDTLERKFRDAFVLLKQRYPSLKQIYCSGRDYGGYSNPGQGNPEPYAYYTGWAFHRLVQRQLNGDPALAYEGPDAPVPWLAWANYIWSDGANPNNDGLAWLCPQDYQNDGVHPNANGVGKVATRLFQFFRTEPTTTWYRAPEIGTGLSEVQATEPLLFFPNPTGGLLQLDLPPGAVPQVRVWDAAGRVVLQAQERWLDLGGMPVGLYAVEVWMEGKRWMGRVVKE